MNLEAQQLEEEIKAAIQRASAGHNNSVTDLDPELLLKLQARNVLALVWPKIKPRLS